MSKVPTLRVCPACNFQRLKVLPSRPERCLVVKSHQMSSENSLNGINFRRQRKKPVKEKLSEDIPVARIGPGPTANFFSSKSWKDLGASEDMVDALNVINIKRPSHIQAAAFSALNSEAMHVLLADHAGSGKTLSYLVPLIQKLKQDESENGGPFSAPGQPRIVIVVPTSELCAQVLRVCRALSQRLKFRSAAFTGGRPLRTQKKSLEQGVDVLIGTPGRLGDLISNGFLNLKACSTIVFDEVDVLLGPASSFAEQVLPLKDQAAEDTQFVMVTATLPSDIYEEIELRLPGIVSALGPGLHRTAPGCIEQIVDCSGGTEITEESGIQRKSVAMLASLQEQKSARTIVFCNKIETCRKVENFLNRSIIGNDVEVLPYHAAIAGEKRDANLSRFLCTPKQDDGKEEKRLILVCTDRASRGVDSSFVDHVILFDFPREPSEYVRRVGRTARGAGGQGVVTVLVLGRQVKLAQHVSGRNQKGLPVHSIPAIIPANIE